MFKHLPHRVLPEYNESLYVDNTVLINAGIEMIFQRLSLDSPFVCFRHPIRDCIYAEAQEVLAVGYEDSDIVFRQMDTYRRLGYPENNGLIWGGVLLRRHGTKALHALMDAWHCQVLRFSKRDQLSFNICAWFYNIQPHYFPGTPIANDLIEWPHPKNMVRIPRNFKDHKYLELNPDVAISGMNPRKHYLLFGHAEGRAIDSPG
jgi:hypothetical protein